jgi:hypothetical protein
LLINSNKDDAMLVTLGTNHLADQQSVDDIPNAPIDLFDLRADVPPPAEPVVPLQHSYPLMEQDEEEDEEDNAADELVEDDDEENDEESDADIGLQEQNDDGNATNYGGSLITDIISSIHSFLSTCIGDGQDEGDDDEAVDQLQHPHQSIFYDKCVHKGTDITSGSSGADDSSSSSMNAWLDDAPVMTSKEKRKVQKFMKKLRGKKRRFR